MAWYSVMMDRERRTRSDHYAPSARGEQRHWQIGPRIRVGGTLGKIGQNVKIATGKALENPIVDGALAMIPGAGPILSGAAGAMGRIYDTSNGGLHGLSGLGSVAMGGAEGYGAGKLGQLAHGALGGLGGGGAAGATGATGDAAGGGGFLGTLEGLGGKALGAIGGSGGIGGMLGGLGKDALGFLTGNGGMNALGAAGAVNAALLQNKANEYAKNALGQQQQAYNERAPLRTQGLQAMQSAMAANPYSGTAMPQRPPNALGMNPGIRPVTLGGGV